MKKKTVGNKSQGQPLSDHREIQEKLLEAHRRGVEQAIDLSIRTGVPLVVMENGKIKYIKPKFKYVKVPIGRGKK